MRKYPYASAVGSLMYAMLCTRPDICYAVGIVSRYQSNPGLEHWIAVKHILKYLKRTRDYMLVYSGSDLEPIDILIQIFSLTKIVESLLLDHCLLLEVGQLSGEALNNPASLIQPWKLST